MFWGLGTREGVNDDKLRLSSRQCPPRKLRPNTHTHSTEFFPACGGDNTPKSNSPSNESHTRPPLSEPPESAPSLILQFPTPPITKPKR